MHFIRNTWLLATALAAVSLIPRAVGLPDTGMSQDYLGAAQPHKPQSYSANVKSSQESPGTRYNDAELAAIAQSAMGELDRDYPGHDVVVVSVLQDGETLDLYIASTVKVVNMGMHPPNWYLINERLRRLDDTFGMIPGHRTRGMCAECNVLRLFEDKTGLRVEPSAHSRIIAWSKSGNRVWNPCGYESEQGCQNLIDLYPTVTAVRSPWRNPVLPAAAIPLARFDPFPRANPRKWPGITCQAKRDDGGNATSCERPVLEGDTTEYTVLLSDESLDSPTNNGTMSSTTMLATTLETLTSSLASLSLPAFANSTESGTSMAASLTTTRSRITGTAPLIRSTSTSTATGTSISKLTSMIRSSPTSSSLSSTRTRSAGSSSVPITSTKTRVTRPTSIQISTSTTARTTRATSKPVVSPTTKITARPTKKAGRVARDGA